MKEKQSPEKLNQNQETKQHNLVLYNDDIHTFDYVIDMLMHYCNHNLYQAEQCALLVHHQGKNIVKKGSYEELEPIATALLEKDLSVEIE